MTRVTHHYDRPENQPLAEQLRQRLRTLCEFEEWPITDRLPAASMVFQPWEASDPPVNAEPVVLTLHKKQEDVSIAILLLSIRATIPRMVMDRYLNPLTADCARCGVNLTLEGPCAARPEEACGGVIVVSEESPPPGASRFGTSQTRPELWERISLTIALTGHSLNADCLYETLVLLFSAHTDVLKYCGKAARE